MSKDKKNQQQATQQGMTNVAKTAEQAYQGTQNPSALEGELAPLSHNFSDLYNLSTGRQMQDYGDVMGGYDQFLSGQDPNNYERVSYNRPDELGEAFGYMRETAPGFRDFAQTGGYSAKDIQELRARGMSPIRSAYGNTMMELNRSKALGGSGGAPNYIAAVSRAQRELPGQMADAMTGVNAQLAQDIRKGKLEGLSGLAGLGTNMGNLSDSEANRIMNAQVANQQAGLQSRSMYNQAMLSGLSGKTSMYGTTPGMTNMFGNQVLNAYGMRTGAEEARNRRGVDLLNAQMSGYQGANAAVPQGRDWLSTGLQVAGTVAPYAAAYMGNRNRPATTAPSAQQVNPNFNFGNVGSRVNAPSAPPPVKTGTYSGLPRGANYG